MLQKWWTSRYERSRLNPAIEDRGARFELRQDGVHLVRPKGAVLPPELIEAARARKAEIQEALRSGQVVHSNSDAADREERAAIMEHDGQLPREWADTFAAISLSAAPGDFDPDRWRDTLDGMLRFCDQWAGRAAALGWQLSEVFSLDLVAPQARVDRRGLGLSLGNGEKVIAIDIEGADIETRSGSRLRFYRNKQ